MCVYIYIYIYTCIRLAEDLAVGEGATLSEGIAAFIAISEIGGAAMAPREPRGDVCIYIYIYISLSLSIYIYI